MASTNQPSTLTRQPRTAAQNSAALQRLTTSIHNDLPDRHALILYDQGTGQFTQYGPRSAVYEAETEIYRSHANQAGPGGLAYPANPQPLGTAPKHKPAGKKKALTAAARKRMQEGGRKGAQARNAKKEKANTAGA